MSFLVIVGALGSVGGYLTGLGIEPEFRGAGAQFDALLDAHMFWATATLVLSVLFALLHAVVLFIKPPEELALAAVKPGFRLWLRKFAFRLTHLPFSALVGSVLLCVITVTGALGGAIAYGRDADPLVAFVIRFLGL